MIKIENLNKSYGSTEVLSNINLEIEEDKIYGLLGRNGVGKTTLLNIIANLISSNSGSVSFQGEDIYENSKALESIAIVKEDGFGTEDIKVKVLFKAARILYKNWDEDYAKVLIEEFKLDIKKNYNKLSRGNKTIVGLVIGLASRAPLTLFDEPSLGLDAAFRYKFYNLLLQDSELNPRTVIISTHLIDEVTNLFEEVIILKDKEVYLKEEVEKLMKKSYFLSGKLENMSEVIRDKKVISKEAFGTINIIGIFDHLSVEEKETLKANNIEISSIPLQKLFVLLTQDKLEEVS